MPLCTLIYLTALSWVFHKHFRLNTIKIKIMTFPLKLTSAVLPSSVVFVVGHHNATKVNTGPSQFSQIPLITLISSHL